MVHAFVPEHLLYLSQYLYDCHFNSDRFDLQCIYRTIISRSYYAAYLYTREWVFSNGIYNNLENYMIRDAGVHKAVIIALNKLKQHKVASKLNEFRLLRVVADYKIVNIITEEDAEKALNLANDIFSQLK